MRRGKPEEVVADLIKQLGSVSTVAFHEEVVKRPFSHCSGHNSITLWDARNFFSGRVPGNFGRTECGETSEGCLCTDEGQGSHLLGLYTVPQR